MIALHELIAQVVAANGGKVVGKTRLQKMFFLLDECGLNSGCRYGYHYYGPFSPEIAAAAEDASGLGMLEYKESAGFHAVPYGIYEARGDIEPSATAGDLKLGDLKSKLSVMKDYSAIELEVAATIVYLRNSGSQNPDKDVALLKPLKASPERLRRANVLLKQL